MSYEMIDRSAECCYKNCGHCFAKGCACVCHLRDSNLREQIAKRILSVPSNETYNHHRGRPRKITS